MQLVTKHVSEQDKREGKDLDPLEVLQLTKEEQDAAVRHWQDITIAKNARTARIRRFDNLNLLQDYQANEDAVTSYLRPKRNDQEVRVHSGATEKRVEVVVNELLAMAISHELHPFDKNDLEIKRYGEVMEASVTKTHNLENGDDVLRDMAYELVSQRAVFAEEVFLDKYASGYNMGMPEKRLRTALEIILGDITLPSYKLQKQPFIVSVERAHYGSLEQVWGKNERWKFVKPGMNLTLDFYPDNQPFTLGDLQENECEVVRIWYKAKDEHQVYINKMPMFKGNPKIPSRRNGTPYYPLAMGIPKRLSSTLAYGKPISASMKFLQAFNDETIRNIIRKFRQAIDPPQAVAGSSKTYSRDIFEAGSITHGVDASLFKPLIQHQGVTSSEMNMLNTVRELIDEFAGRGAQQMGLIQGPKRSATEIVQAQQAAIKMLGTLVLNWESFIRDMTYLRVYNIEQNMMKANGSKYDPITGELRKTYRSLTVKNQKLGNGRKGSFVINFSDRDLTENEIEGLAEEEERLRVNGENKKVFHVNVNSVKGVKWYVVTTTKPKETDDFHRLMFGDKFNQGMALAQATGRKFNDDMLIAEYEETWKTKDWFADPEPASQLVPPAGGPQPPAAVPDVGNLLGDTLGQGPKLANQAQQQQVQPTPANALAQA